MNIVAKNNFYLKGESTIMTNYLLEAAQQPNAGAAFMTQIVIIALMFGFLYFFMIRPQKKRDKELQSMRNSLEVGDEVITIGGIVGFIVSIKEDTVVIETGSDRNKMRITKWAIQSNITATERNAEAKKIASEKAAAEKAEKKADKKEDK